jgi:hypothetical protein
MLDLSLERHFCAKFLPGPWLALWNLEEFG